MISNRVGDIEEVDIWIVEGLSCSCSHEHPIYFMNFNDGKCVANREKKEIKFLGKKKLHIVLRPETGTPVSRFVGQNVHGKVVTKENLGTF